jgi:hypothetical protein
MFLVEELEVHLLASYQSMPVNAMNTLQLDE